MRETGIERGEPTERRRDFPTGTRRSILSAVIVWSVAVTLSLSALGGVVFFAPALVTRVALLTVATV